jgi:hypothetical protein
MMLTTLALFSATLVQDPILVRPDAREPRTPMTTEQGPSRTVDLDIDDLVPLRDFPPLDDKEDPAQRKMRATAGFAEVLQHWMKPAFDPKTDTVRAIAPGHVLLVANEEKTTWADRFCKLQGSARDPISIEVRILSVPRGTLARLGIDGPTRTFEKSGELDALIERAKAGGADLLCAPRVVSMPRQKSSVSAIEQVAYVRDWRIEIVEPGPQTIAVPTVDTVQDGVTVEERVTPLDAEVYGLELSFTNSKLVRPIRTKKMRIGTGEGHEVEVGLPEVDKVSLNTSATLANGASIVLSTLSNEPDRELAVAVTLRRVPSEGSPR